MESPKNKTKESKLKTNQTYLSKFKTISVRFRLDDVPELEAAAAADGKSLSAYIAAVALDASRRGDKNG